MFLIVGRSLVISNIARVVGYFSWKDCGIIFATYCAAGHMEVTQVLHTRVNSCQADSIHSTYKALFAAHRMVPSVDKHRERMVFSEGAEGDTGLPRQLPLKKELYHTCIRLRHGFFEDHLKKLSSMSTSTNWNTQAHVQYYMLIENTKSQKLKETKLMLSTNKGLVCCTPTISFVSNLFTGNISDKELTQRSFILNLRGKGRSFETSQYPSKHVVI